ncbi:MAG: Crp/Fnr family transcriptional regulator [Chryseotalea sp.]|jgi:CRP-like cAMP-binding protein
MELTDFILSIVPFPIDDAKFIAANFQSLTLKKGEIVLQKGKVSDDYIYLEEGLMRSYLYDLDGNEVTTDIFTEKNIAFEITSFFNRTPSETFMEALTECKGLKINYEKLNELFHNKPTFREFGRAILVREFIASKKRNYAMINQTAEQRYQNLITHKPEIIKYVPLKYIASYLGITDSTLSRIRAKF